MNTTVMYIHTYIIFLVNFINLSPVDPPYGGIGTYRNKKNY